MNTPEHSPLPWRLYGLDDVEDANGTPCASGWHPDADWTAEGHAQANANAEFIVKAVNKHDTLRKLVRRFIGIVNHLPLAVTGVALMEAEVEGADKMECGELVSQGYKRIALLMQEAYRETGEEDE